MKKILFLIILTCAISFAPLIISAAEILQISNSNTLLLGDQNRNYTVRIACLEVEPSQDSNVISFLGSELPRHSRVNLQPKGSQEGILISKVIPIGSEHDIAQSIVSRGWGKYTC